MICRLCLINSEGYLQFFDENGLILNLASIVSKYFWFQLRENDPISNIICNNCWICVESFHKFYTSIEEAQNNLKDFQLNSSEVETKVAILKIEDNSKDFNDICVELFNDNHSTTKNLQVLQDFKISIENNSEYNHLENLLDPLEKKNEEKKVQIVKNRKYKIKSTKKKRSQPKTSDNLKTEKFELINTLKLDPLVEAAHDAKISSFMKLICDECQEEFPKFMSLKRHVRTKHNRSGYVTCCNKKLYKRVFLLEHINLHLNPDYYRCQECNKSFATRQSFENHKLTRHQTNETKIYKCDFCPRRYAKKYLVAQHNKLSHTGDNEKKWKCDICDKGFVTKNRMMTHKNYMHKNSYSKICDICAKVCRSKSIFDRHILEHKGIVEPKVQCEICEAWLKNSLSLKKHITRHKEETIQHICNICGKIAPSRGALKSHIRYVHTEALYKCTVCEKSFKKPIGLKEHMSTHTGEILYTCSLCPKTFNSNANMWSHKKKAHRDQWETDRKNRKAPQEIDLKTNLLVDVKLF